MIWLRTTVIKVMQQDTNMFARYIQCENKNLLSFFLRENKSNGKSI